ncbi:vWA domain-containing protein [Oceanithermus sp.]
MQLTHPWFLLGLALLPWVRGRLNKLVFLLLILGASGPMLPLGREKIAVLIDLSPSAGTAASRKAAELGLRGSIYLGFAERTARLPNAGARRTDLGRTTNLQRALNDAVEARADRVILVSDGLWRQNPSSPLPVSTVYAKPPPHAGLSQLITPAAPRTGEVVEVRAVIESTVRGRATIEFTAGEAREVREVALEPGRSDVAFRFRLQKPTSVTVMLRTDCCHDEMQTRLEPLSPGSALVISDEATAAYLEASGWNVRRGKPSDLAQTPDLVVIGNSASEWTALERGRLENYLASGGAVLWTATARGLFFGGWQNTALANKIPLKPAPEEGVALILVLDVSGSMAQENPSKLSRAVAGAQSLLENAGPEDTVGIIAFADESRWLLPPSRMTYTAKRRAETALAGLSAGGGTSLAPAYEAAAASLEKATAKKRLILVISDGQLEPAEAKAVIARAKKAACCVKTSSLALGADADRRFLKNLAAAGGGSFFDVARSQDLTELLNLFGQSAFKKSELRGRFPVTVLTHPVTRGVGELPPLSVIMPAEAPSWATVVVLESGGRPVLAIAEANGGRVAALATDLSRSWKDSPAASLLLANLARWLTNTPARPRYQWLDEAGGRSLLVYGRFDPLPLAQWEGKTVPLEPTSPLSFRLRLPPGFSQPVRISSGGKTVFVAEPPRPDEWPPVDGREQLEKLANSSGGEVLTGPPPEPQRKPVGVKNYLWLLALLIFMVERWRESAVG